MEPVVSFIIVVLIGVAAGFLAQRLLPASWISTQIAGRHRATVTSVLVGIAGSFIGFHLGILLNLAGSGSIALFIAAAIGAALVLWGWKRLSL